MGKKTKKLPKYTVPIDCLCTGGLKTKLLSISETVNHFTYLATLCEYLFVVRASKSVIPYKEVPSDSTIYFYLSYVYTVYHCMMVTIDC